MQPFWIDIAVAVSCGLLGGAAGWLVRGGSPASEDAQDDAAAHAQEALRRLQELSLDVKADVGQHGSQVQAINAELSAAGDEPEVVVNSIAKLIEANDRMQGQLASAEEKLQQQAEEIETHVVEARTDALTDLANRRAFDDELQRRLRQWQDGGVPHCLLMLDVDHFKKFNDVHGHQAGDEVLRGVARVLKKCVRGGDLVARYGGEEFAVIFPASQVEQVTDFVLRSRREIEVETFHFQGKQLRVTVSEGVAQIADGEDAASLIRRADEGLYASKEAGRNCAHFDDGKTCHLLNEESAVVKPSEYDQQTQAETETQRDEFTALPDSDAFREDVQRRLAESKRYGTDLSLSLLRVDGLTERIAKQGEPAARLVLQTVTKFLEAAMREMDFVARYDDHTFSMLLPGAQLSDAAVVAERLRKAIGRCTLKLLEKPLEFSVSIGLTSAITNDCLQGMATRAEAALARSVLAGGNMVSIHDGRSIVEFDKTTAPAG